MHNCEYLLRRFSEEFFLIPYGQENGDRKPAIKLNKSGALLWEALLQGKTYEELLRSWPAQDIESFLTRFNELGILENEPSFNELSLNEPSRYFRIGPLSLSYSGPTEFIHPFMDAFSCAEIPVGQHIQVIRRSPLKRHNGQLLIRTGELLICMDSLDYILLFQPPSRIEEVRIRKDGSLAVFFVSAAYDDDLRDELFHAMRFSYLVFAQRQGLFVLHCAAVQYLDKAWLFAGSSGTGKSTHTALWRKLFDTPILNGDLILIGLNEEQITVYGLPWCGTSGIYTTKSCPLGGIIFLQQGKENSELPLSAAQSRLKLYNRLISPAWTKEQLALCLDFSDALAGQAALLSFACTKDAAAAITMKNIIDQRYITPGADIS